MNQTDSQLSEQFLIACNIHATKGIQDDIFEDKYYRM